MQLASGISWTTSLRFYPVSLAVMVRVSKLLLLCFCCCRRRWRGFGRMQVLEGSETVPVRRLFCFLLSVGRGRVFLAGSRTKEEEPVGRVADCTPLWSAPGRHGGQPSVTAMGGGTCWGITYRLSRSVGEHFTKDGASVGHDVQVTYLASATLPVR
ncbi:hypothetical protein QBC34DRAFT_102211 [Podospora aff. communis PSN243]|uniref:Secreted protein n=1 Tax=Podospora aff. communis PSN243 TaxID=3040156 RepID=A0AAV9GIY4_9PEZI|nr:hypothetical protein QBC34DRAFT_102211 [Podospora aff. communis PSN243]